MVNVALIKEVCFNLILDKAQIDWGSLNISHIAGPDKYNFTILYLVVIVK